MAPRIPENAWTGVVRDDCQKMERADSSAMLSASHMSVEEEHHAHEDKLVLPPSYPLPLILFVCFLSIIGGFVVVGVHYAVIYSGCPLGLNGCNQFLGKQEKGFFLTRWVQNTFGSEIPVDVVYICASVLGAVVLTELWKRLPARLVVQSQGGGTMQALVAVAVGERITLTAAALRIFASSLYLGTGGTLGMDGPAIQVCTAATTFFGWIVGMRAVATQSLLACLGFASGFAASFNSPLAGILFAMEELQHVSSRVSRHIICIIVLASVVSTAVARACHGDNELFDVEWGRGVGFGQGIWMLLSVPIGIVCSLFGFAISTALTSCWQLIDLLERKLSRRMVFILAVLLSASIASCVYRITDLRGVWGIGYESLQLAFDKDIRLAHFFVFAVGKALAMVVSVAVKCPGDILEPVLISGAFLGGGIGSVLQQFIQDEVLASEILRPCIIFGMVGLFASCFRFPLTPVVIVLEFLGEEAYSIVLPTALAGFTAITCSNRLFPPLLDAVLHRDGICLETLQEEADGQNEENNGDETSFLDEAESDRQSVASSRSHGSRRSSHASSMHSKIFHDVEYSMRSLGAQRIGKDYLTPPGSKQGSNGSRSNSNGSPSPPGSVPCSSRRPSISSHSACTGSRRPSRTESRSESASSTITSLGFTLNIPAAMKAHPSSADVASPCSSLPGLLHANVSGAPGCCSKDASPEKRDKLSVSSSPRPLLAMAAVVSEEVSPKKGSASDLLRAATPRSMDSRNAAAQSASHLAVGQDMNSDHAEKSKRQISWYSAEATEGEAYGHALNFRAGASHSSGGSVAAVEAEGSGAETDSAPLPSFARLASRELGNDEGDAQARASCSALAATSAPIENDQDIEPAGEVMTRTSSGQRESVASAEIAGHEPDSNETLPSAASRIDSDKDPDIEEPGSACAASPEATVEDRPAHGLEQEHRDKQ